MLRKDALLALVAELVPQPTSLVMANDAVVAAAVLLVVLFEVVLRQRQRHKRYAEDDVGFRPSR